MIRRSKWDTKMNAPGKSVTPLKKCEIIGEIDDGVFKFMVFCLWYNNICPFILYEASCPLEVKYADGELERLGCAFVKYETKEQAVAAIEDLNGKHKMEVVYIYWAATQTPSATRIETTPPAALCGSTITTLRDGTDEGEAHPDKCDDIHLLYALQET
ncbi:RNA-binding protein BRN1 isoform X2 [Tanacetum coccineum]|uniref:RNA-binding protein BRN1 isoform X2 n=1 Tax=Tanacetum coccineum TaxID=301880 RepID=A0ABQ4X8Z0_9ASTR